jgi:hypothetical protein
LPTALFKENNLKYSEGEKEQRQGELCKFKEYFLFKATIIIMPYRFIVWK